VLVVGKSIYTIVIANLDEIVSQLDVTSSLYKMKMDKIKLWVARRGGRSRSARAPAADRPELRLSRSTPSAGLERRPPIAPKCAFRDLLL
jgi:hypothetical protein